MNNNQCTLCESIKFINDNNRSNLNKDPMHLIFVKSEPEKNDEFWKLVEEKCGWYSKRWYTKWNTIYYFETRLLKIQFFIQVIIKSWFYKYMYIVE